MSGFKLSAFADEYSPVFTEQVAELKKLGISLIEPRGVDGVNVSKITEAKAYEMRGLLDANGISISAIGAPAGKAVFKDFDEHFKDYLNTLKAAKILGAKRIRGFSFYETDKDKVFGYLDKLINEASKAGILYCHENEKGIYGQSPERCLEILEAFKGSIGCVFDPANFIQCGANPLKAFEMLYPYITYLHIKDAEADGTICAAGEGVSDIPSILNKLKETDSEYVLTIEPHLKVFGGLSALEGSERPKIQTAFKTNAEAFEYAVAALRKLIP